jgi:hypothetical protein
MCNGGKEFWEAFAGGRLRCEPSFILGYSGPGRLVRLGAGVRRVRAGSGARVRQVGQKTVMTR